MKNTFIYILLLLSFNATAQSLSIQDLWNRLGETNNAKLDQLQIAIANKDLKIQNLNRYPIVFADANIQRNLIIPTTPVPAIAFDPSATEGAILPLKFATKYNNKAGLQAEWKLFDPSRKTDLETKKIALEKAQIQQKSNAQELKKEATLAYTSIILASLQYQAAIQDSIKYKQILESVTYRHEVGRETTEQLLIAKQEFERKKIQLNAAYTVLFEADLEIQKHIDINHIKDLSSSIEEIQNALEGYQVVYYDAQLNKLDLQSNANDLRSFKRQLLPSLTFNAYYGSQYFNNNFNLFKSENWFGNSYANIALRLPISAYITQKPSLDKLNSERLLNELNLEQTTKLNGIKQLQLNQKIKAAKQKVQSLRTIVHLSEENINQQDALYNSGRILLSDYNRNLSNHISTQQELWQAEFDLIKTYLD